MSTRPTLGITFPRKGMTVRPVKAVTEIDQKFLENPSEVDLKRWRSEGWSVAFETFAMASTPNAGVKKCHFVRLEKQIKVSTSLFIPEQ